MEKQRKQEIRDTFDAWRETLNGSAQEDVEFSEIDGYLRMLFVSVQDDDFPMDTISELESQLQELDEDLRVGIEDHR